jgi:hypothetical protein
MISARISSASSASSGRRVLSTSGCPEIRGRDAVEQGRARIVQHFLDLQPVDFLARL